MTLDRMALAELIEKGSDIDLVRAMLAHTAERVMELEVEQLCGAGHGERVAERRNHRNGYRERAWDTRTGRINLHGKRYDIRRSLEERGFEFEASIGTTSYGGRYRRGEQAIIVTLSPGLGDVVEVGKVIAECKGGIVNTRHAGQLSRLRRGLCEAVGLLMARPREQERHIAVVPFTETSLRLAKRMVPRAAAAGIELALVDESGGVMFVDA